MTEQDQALWLPIGELCFRANWDTEDVRLRLERGRYADGNTAIRAVIADTGEPFATLSINIGEPLGDGEFYLKDYSENTELADVFARVGYIERVLDADPYPIASGHLVECFRLVG